MLNYKTYRDKIKGCWLGKNIGGTFGAPLEGKSCMEFDRFYDFYLQDLTGEPVPNDDLDLQLVWLNAAEKYKDRLNSRIWNAGFCRRFPVGSITSTNTAMAGLSAVRFGPASRQDTRKSQ